MNCGSDKLVSYRYNDDCTLPEHNKTNFAKMNEAWKMKKPESVVDSNDEMCDDFQTQKNKFIV